MPDGEREVLYAAQQRELEAFAYRLALAGCGWKEIAERASRPVASGGIERPIRPTDARRAAVRESQRIVATIERLEDDEAANVAAMQRVHAELLRYWSEHHDDASWELAGYLDGLLHVREQIPRSSAERPRRVDP